MKSVKEEIEEDKILVVTVPEHLHVAHAPVEQKPPAEPQSAMEMDEPLVPQPTLWPDWSNPETSKACHKQRGSNNYKSGYITLG